jgi:hypothetical protein
MRIPKTGGCYRMAISPKDTSPKEVDGKEIKVSVDGLKLIPPKSGTAVVRPGRK